MNAYYYVLSAVSGCFIAIILYSVSVLKGKKIFFWAGCIFQTIIFSIDYFAKTITKYEEVVAYVFYAISFFCILPYVIKKHNILSENKKTREDFMRKNAYDTYESSDSYPALSPAGTASDTFKRRYKPKMNKETFIWFCIVYGLILVIQFVALTPYKVTETYHTNPGYTPHSFVSERGYKGIFDIGSRDTYVKDGNKYIRVEEINYLFLFLQFLFTTGIAILAYYILLSREKQTGLKQQIELLEKQISIQTHENASKNTPS